MNYLCLWGFLCVTYAARGDNKISAPVMLLKKGCNFIVVGAPTLYHNTFLGDFCRIIFELKKAGLVFQVLIHVTILAILAADNRKHSHCLNVA